MRRLIECVPNFSEGRDGRVVARIRDALASHGRVALLDWSSDADHNRSVFTVAGAPGDVVEALLRAAAEAVAAIDLRRHEGVHPRIGALDAAPFVPLEGARFADCVEAAEDFARRLWKQSRVPVYFYGEAARSDGRRELESFRKLGFEKLRDAAPHERGLRPDIGGPELHPSAGAAAVGVRKLLIAYNVFLDTADVSIARRIARSVRESSGGLPAVKALGLMIESRNQAQVSMNLTDYERSGLDVVFEAVRRRARELGTEASSSEIIGLVPRRALDAAASCDLKIEGFGEQMILENRLARSGLIGS